MLVTDDRKKGVMFMSDQVAADVPQKCIARWLRDRVIHVRSKSGRALQMRILRLYECSAVDGLALDALLLVRASKRAPAREIGVVFSASKPEHQYPIEVFWARLVDNDDSVLELTRLAS
ncbi:MAG: hypothetical protein AAGI44_08375 [Pseudomonadota bacterium]